MEEIQRAVREGADVNAADKWGNTALHYTARNAHFEVVQFLLEAGANPNAANDRGATALHGATIGGHAEVVQALLNAGADPTHCDEEGLSAEALAKDRPIIAQMVQDAQLPRVLTVKAQRVEEGLELICTTLVGNVAAQICWPDDAPVSSLAQAIVRAVKEAGFTGLKEPLAEWNLRLVQPGALGALLALGPDAPALPEQYGLTEPPPKRLKVA